MVDSRAISYKDGHGILFRGCVVYGPVLNLYGIHVLLAYHKN